MSAAFANTGRVQSPVAQVMSTSPDGSSRAAMPPRPAVRLVQENKAADLLVDVEVLDFSAKHRNGCGIAGCSSGTTTSTEQGIVLQQISTGVRRVVTRGGYDSDPAWSPDGSVIAYTRLEEDPNSDGRVRSVIALLDADGGDLGLAFEPPAHHSDSVPVWSPDARALLVIRGNGSESRLTVVHLDGQSARTLATSRLIMSPAWSPDGRWIAFARERPAPGRGTDLWLVDVRTGAAKIAARARLVPGPDTVSFCGIIAVVLPSVFGISWSPDSRYVAFLSTWPHQRQLGMQSDIQTFEVRTGQLRTAVATPSAGCRGSVVQRRSTALYGWR